jgi:hypothetical protein
MPFFRDEVDKEPDEFLLQRDLPAAERIDNARWLYTCGWYLDAFHIIHSIAQGIKDKPHEEDTYEEQRFAKTSEETERAGGGPEGSPNAGHCD